MLAVAGCSTEQGSTGSSQVLATEVQPRVATYDCGDAGPVTVRNNRTSVMLSSPDGQQVELPVVPESAGARFARESTAVVLDGPEMLLMSGRQEPVNCRR